MRKNMSVVLMMLVLFVFVSLSSGCGGGSSSFPISTTPQSQDVNPNNPNTPNNTPTTPDNQTTTFDFTILNGTWTPSNASGTISGVAGTAKGGSVTLSGSEISFTSIDLSGNTAKADMRMETIWEWDYAGQHYTDEIGLHRANATLQRVNGDTWQWKRTDAPYQDETITITITSPTTARVEQQLNPKHGMNGVITEVYRLVTSFTITKQSSSQTTPNNNPTTTTIPFTTLTGTWQASNGTGTWTGNGINATVSLSTSSNNTITFRNVNVSGNTATFEGSSQIEWAAYQNGAGVAGCEDNFGGDSKEDIGSLEDGSLVEYTNTSGNTWRMERTNHSNNKITRTVITFTSATTAQVERFEDRSFQASVSYTLTKQSDSTTTPETPTTYNLNGTWRIIGGTLTGSSISANYVNSSVETFTLALSEADSEHYTLSVSGEGVKIKESTPYIETYFEGMPAEVRVLWGTSTGYHDGESICILSAPNTYSLSYYFSIHDVTSAKYQLLSDSTIRYTQTGPSIHGYDTDVNVVLTLERVK